jgi:hypothetical protein
MPNILKNHISIHIQAKIDCCPKGGGWGNSESGRKKSPGSTSGPNKALKHHFCDLMTRKPSKLD